METFSPKFSIASLVLLLSSCWTQRIATITETEYRTVISRVTLTSNFVCAKLVRVTGTCRHGRGLPIEDLQSQFAPTKTFGMDATPLVESPEVKQKRSASNLPSFLVIEPSMSSRENSPTFRTRQTWPGIVFFKSIPVNQMRVTVTNVITRTEHLFRTTGTTTSVVFRSCTPNHLPYSMCPEAVTEEDDDILQNRLPFRMTKTKISTETVTVTVKTTGLCAKLVNVTGPCRRRKELWIEEPIVLSFDDDMDAIDAALSPTSIIETTAMPELMSEGRNLHFTSGSQVIRPSSEEDEPDQRLGFNLILKWKNSLIERFQSVTTIFTTLTRTSFITVSTKTFFVQLCTPSPFPFSVCSGRKKRSSQLDNSL